MGDFSNLKRLYKDDLKARAQALAEKLGITLEARTKEELASFIVFYKGKTPEQAQAYKASR